jgi:hypothetical protein
MKSPKSVKSLDALGRVRLSDSFFMRDFLHSEISQITGIPNIPSNPDLAIEVGTHLCSEVLEPIQAKFGRLSIRSAYRSAAINEIGAAKGNQFGCGNNRHNRSRHIWDELDEHGNKGAMTCIVVSRFIPYFERTRHWQALAWWIHDMVPDFAEMEFFKINAALNVSWHEKPQKTIRSWIPGIRTLTKPGMDNHYGSHRNLYAAMLDELGLSEAA